MSEWYCPVVRFTVHPHPNADRLELLKFGNTTVVVGKGEYPSDHNKGVWLKPGTLIPQIQLQDMPDFFPEDGVVGEKRFRGIVSEGLLYFPPHLDISPVGFNMAPTLGCTSAKPDEEKLKASDGGATRVTVLPIRWKTQRYENFREMWKPDETVCVTEKLNGTFCAMGWNATFGHFVSSKGLLARGMGIDIHAEDTADDLYVQQFFKHLSLIDELRGDATSDYILLGEIIGPKIQNNHYQLDAPDFRVFDIIKDRVVQDIRSDAHYKLEGTSVRTVPILYIGEFYEGLADGLASGRSRIRSVAQQEPPVIREGIVMKSVPEQYTADLNKKGKALGRKVVKHYNPAWKKHGRQ